MSFFDRAQSVTFAGKAVEKLVLDGKKIWEAVSFKNWVRDSTEADGMTIYNGGLGYKDGYRIRSGGAEASSSGITISGFIPYKKGDRLYIYPPFFGGNTENTINFYNAAFEHLGQIAVRLTAFARVRSKPRLTMVFPCLTFLKLLSRVLKMWRLSVWATVSAITTTGRL